MSRTQGQREFEGADLDEALAKASKALDIEEPELDYEILEQGRRGLWGIGHKSVRIRVMPPIQPVESIDHTELTTAAITGGRSSRPRRERGGRGGRGRGRRGGAGAGGAAAGGGAAGGADAVGNQQVGQAKQESTQQGRPRGGRRRSGRGSGESRRRGGADRSGGGRQRGSGEGRPPRERHRSRSKPTNRPEVTPEEAAKVEVGLQKMVDLMGLDLTAEIREINTGVALDLKGPDEELLTSKDSELLSSLEFLLNRMSRRSWPDSGRIYVGSDGHRAQRDDDVVELVKEVVQQVLTTGRSKRLHPMNSYERRLAHLTVREFPELGSRSEGDGPVKKVRIYKLRGGKRRPGGGRPTKNEDGQPEAAAEEPLVETAAVEPTETPAADVDEDTSVRDA